MQCLFQKRESVHISTELYHSNIVPSIMQDYFGFYFEKKIYVYTEMA
jgi:hypothetical protein